jgi:hypothetical protein
MQFAWALPPLLFVAMSAERLLGGESGLSPQPVAISHHLLTPVEA